MTFLFMHSASSCSFFFILSQLVFSIVPSPPVSFSTAQIQDSQGFDSMKLGLEFCGTQICLQFWPIARSLNRQPQQIKFSNHTGLTMVHRSILNYGKVGKELL